MALLSMNSEGAVLDWGALYLARNSAATSRRRFRLRGLRRRHGADAIFGDGVRNRLGAVATFRISSIVAAVGMLVAGLAALAVAGHRRLRLSGLGIANMVPILFSAAGNQPGVSPGAGMSVVTTMGYSGILAAPSMIGFVGERSALRRSYRHRDHCWACLPAIRPDPHRRFSPTARIRYADLKAATLQARRYGAGQTDDCARVRCGPSAPVSAG